MDNARMKNWEEGRVDRFRIAERTRRMFGDVAGSRPSELKTRNILKLARILEEAVPEEKYNQSRFVGSRNPYRLTVSTDIFGHAAAAFSGAFARALERAVSPYVVGRIVLDGHLARAMGEEIFGIDEWAARDLAAPVPPGFTPECLPRTEDAVAVLRHLAETGKVDWSVAPNAGKSTQGGPA